MNKLRVTYLALGAFVFAASCTKEAAEPDVFDWADGNIYFKPSVSDVVGSRAQDMTLARLESFQVTCFNTAARYTDSQGFLSPYFENATFVRNSSSSIAAYVTPPDEIPWGWPSSESLIKFFAFSPSIEVMSEGIQDDGCFKLLNRSTLNDASFSADYRLCNIRINHDIAKQFDFITASAAGERYKDFTGGVELGFSHQLSQVELKAWGDGSKHEFEIAGVLIGNPVVEGEFIFADDANPASSYGWNNSGMEKKDKVENIYRFSDRTYRINQTEHNTAESAGSIMGIDGCAMVIPTVNAAWEGTADPNIANSPYSTDKMYFGVLTRVVDSASGSVIYPYPDDKTGMSVVSFVLNGSGVIWGRVYKSVDGNYFRRPNFTLPYVAPEGFEIRDFGWAAIPVGVDWKAGKRYVYTLDFSEGIGLHIPEDPDPGKPIKGKSAVEWGVAVEEWNYAEKNEDFEPDVDVP